MFNTTTQPLQLNQLSSNFIFKVIKRYLKNNLTSVYENNIR